MLGMADSQSPDQVSKARVSVEELRCDDFGRSVLNLRRDELEGIQQDECTAETMGGSDDQKLRAARSY